MYIYELPTTGAVSFADFCVDYSAERVYNRHIPEASQARANLRGALKDGKRADHGEKDFLGLVKVCLLFWCQSQRNNLLPDNRGIYSLHSRSRQLCHPR